LVDGAAGAEGDAQRAEAGGTAGLRRVAEDVGTRRDLEPDKPGSSDRRS
jgi:hypothetical protein